MVDVSSILSQIEEGDSSAADRLLPLVYDELRRMAALMLDQERPGQTLQPTALVHEAYLRLVGPDCGELWNGKGHFFGAAAIAMQRILVENARRKRRIKRGNGWHRLDATQSDFAVDHDGGLGFDILALDEALNEFASEHPEKARLVQLRFFAGLTSPQAASVLGISTPTADRHWRYARAWLSRRLN